MPRIKPLSEAQNHRCCYCGHSMIFESRSISFVPNAATRDHVVPRAAGGTNYDNLVIACRLCNQLRGDLPALTFFNLLHKWFKEDPTLRARWHHTSRQERYQFKIECLAALERHLYRRAKQSVEHAFRHFQLTMYEGHHFTRAT